MEWRKGTGSHPFESSRVGIIFIFIFYFYLFIYLFIFFFYFLFPLGDDLFGSCDLARLLPLRS